MNADGTGLVNLTDSLAYDDWRADLGGFGRRRRRQQPMKPGNHPLAFERAMTPFRSSRACVLAVAAVACHANAVTSSPVIPLASIHFVHAVPDTARMDFRVVDMVSNAGLFGAQFRHITRFYVPI